MEETKEITEEETKKPCDFFLSYSSDDKEIARRVAQYLKEHGQHTWFAETDLRVGENIYEQITRALNNSRSCLILLSRSSDVSKPWISKEWAAIKECSWRRSDFKIYLVILENVDPPPFLRTCEAFRFNPKKSSVSETIDRLINYKNLAETLEKPTEIEVDKTEMAERYIKIWNLLQEYSEFCHQGGDHDNK